MCNDTPTVLRLIYLFLNLPCFWRPLICPRWIKRRKIPKVVIVLVSDDRWHCLVTYPSVTCYWLIIIVSFWTKETQKFRSGSAVSGSFDLVLLGKKSNRTFAEFFGVKLLKCRQKFSLWQTGSLSLWFEMMNTPFQCLNLKLYFKLFLKVIQHYKSNKLIEDM